MKKLIPIALLAVICACNNSKKEKETTVTGDTTIGNTSTTPTTTTTNNASYTGQLTYSLNDTSRSGSGSILVQKDKDKLSPGNDLLGILTSSTNTDESVTVNFVFTTKPGTYPVVGVGISRTNQVFGGILGGEPKITKYKVKLTECTDLGSNGFGGHKWRISGSVDEEMVIDAMDLMKMSPGHPDNIRLSKFQFSNFTFDDNMEEVLEKGLEKLKQQ